MITKTKKEIKESIKNVEDSSFQVANIGAYEKEGETELYVVFRGQGMPDAVYNEKYSKIYDFTDNYKEYLIKQISLDDLVDIIYDTIN